MRAGGNDLLMMCVVSSTTPPSPCMIDVEMNAFLRLLLLLLLLPASPSLSLFVYVLPTYLRGANTRKQVYEFLREEC